MSEEIRVTTIEIKIGDTLVSVSPEQAKALLAKLQTLFGEKPERVVVRDYIPVARRPWLMWDSGPMYSGDVIPDYTPQVWCYGDSRGATARLSVC